jgi:hypothetical protein
MMGLPLEDPDPEPLIKRGQGKWTLPNSYQLNTSKPIEENQIQIVTAKTTLAHNSTIQVSDHYYNDYLNIIKEQLFLTDKQQDELEHGLSRFTKKWMNSINSIKKLHEL